MRFQSYSRIVISAIQVAMAVALIGCGRRDPVVSSTVSESQNSTSEQVAKQAADQSADQAGDQVIDPPVQIAEATPIVETTPIADDVATIQRLGMAALRDGDLDAAFQSARQAMRLAPEDPQVVFLMAMALGEQHRFPEAIRMLDRLAVTAPEVRLPALGQTSEWLVRFGRYADAELRYRSILDEIPDAVMVHRNLALLLLRQGRRREAHEHLLALCKLGDVQEMELRSLLIGLHPLLDDAEQAEMEPISNLALARMEISHQRWSEALRILEQSESLTPEEDALLGRVLAVIGDRSRSEASGQIDAGSISGSIADGGAAVDVERVAVQSEAHRRCADAWWADGALAADRADHRLAVRCFAECVLIDPTDHHAYMKLSDSLREIGSIASSDTAKLRSQWIQQTQQIGSQMVNESGRTEERFQQLIALLDALKRPLESLAWRGVSAAYANQWGRLSDADTERTLSEITVQRAALMNRGDAIAADQFVTCGIEPLDFPLP